MSARRARLPPATAVPFSAPHELLGQLTSAPFLRPDARDDASRWARESQALVPSPAALTPDPFLSHGPARVPITLQVSVPSKPHVADRPKIRPRALESSPPPPFLVDTTTLPTSVHDTWPHQGGFRETLGTPNLLHHQPNSPLTPTFCRFPPRVGSVGLGSLGPRGLPR